MGLPNISRDHYITLVAAIIQGRMANPVSANQIDSDWSRKAIIKESMADVDAILQENGSCVIVETDP